MPKFSQQSQLKLATCHPDLQIVCRALIRQYDFSVLEGFRSQTAQEAAFSRGNSQVHWPHSAHNQYPSRAIDIVPYPIDWQDIRRFQEMIFRFDALAEYLRLKEKISSRFVYGGYWAGLQDWPHIEIQEENK